MLELSTRQQLQPEPRFWPEGQSYATHLYLNLYLTLWTPPTEPVGLAHKSGRTLRRSKTRCRNHRRSPPYFERSKVEVVSRWQDRERWGASKIRAARRELLEP